VEAPAPTEALADACEHAVALAYEAGRMQKECGMDVLPDEYARNALKFGLVEVRTCRLHIPPGFGVYAIDMSLMETVSRQGERERNYWEIAATHLAPTGWVKNVTSVIKI
jgi:hypothetical protein